ncbi:hypothetical protein [Flavobacterium sp. 140616W15]|uniref:hypothetical protein n=1 Tax=Flavobacterium sp. 140616W15 TaxID=2478552 RepID=UPI001F5C37F9|nr:hypothetical protein [Flavobacterium sp. 140616W15]
MEQMYIGHGEYKISKTSKEVEWRSPDQIVKQIEMIRALPLIDGSMHFTANVFKRMGDTLRKPIIEKQYKYIALTPEANRITRIKPPNKCFDYSKRKKDSLLGRQD